MAGCLMVLLVDWKGVCVIPRGAVRRTKARAGGATRRQQLVADKQQKRLSSSPSSPEELEHVLRVSDCAQDAKRRASIFLDGLSNSFHLDSTGESPVANQDRIGTVRITHWEETLERVPPEATPIRLSSTGERFPSFAQGWTGEL